MSTKLIPLMRDISEFDENIISEELKTEKFRVWVTVLILASLLLLSLGLRILLISGKIPAFEKNFYDYFPIDQILISLIIALIYESVIYNLLAFFIVRRIRPPDLPRYGNAFAEVTFVTILLWLMTSALHPVIVLNSPIYLFYFIFIILSVLRQKFSLCLFTGAVAAIEYFTLGWFLLAGADKTGFDQFFTSLIPVSTRCAILVIGGMLAGLVTSVVRKRTIRVLQGLAEREKIVSIFGQHISPAVADKLLSRKSEFKGETRQVAVMFLDIRDFSTFSEFRKADEIVDYLNRFFGELIPIINRHNGIINKFLGDGFMAVFGAPISDDNYVMNAVNAAYEMVNKVNAMNESGFIEVTHIGIGIHCGEAVTGNVGSEERKEYTIIGNAVNLASRVEQLNKKFKSTLLVTDALYELVKDNFKGEQLPPALVKGRSDSVQVYKLI